MSDIRPTAFNSTNEISVDRAPLDYNRAVQIMIQNTGGGRAKDGSPSVYVDKDQRCYVYRENVVQAIQMAATFAWDNVVMPGTSLHKNYELLRSLTRGKASPQEQLEAAVLIRALLGDK